MNLQTLRNAVTETKLIRDDGDPTQYFTIGDEHRLIQALTLDADLMADIQGEVFDAMVDRQSVILATTHGITSILEHDAGCLPGWAAQIGGIYLEALHKALKQYVMDHEPEWLALLRADEKADKPYQAQDAAYEAVKDRLVMEGVA